jgi:hypothetical protein
VDGLHGVAEALGDRAHDRVGLAQPEDEPGLRVPGTDDRGARLCGDDQINGAWTRERGYVRASQTPSVVFSTFKAFVGHLGSSDRQSHARQPRVWPVAHCQEDLGQWLIFRGSRGETETYYDACGVNSDEQARSLISSQTIAPSDDGLTGKLSLASSLGISDGYGPAVQGLIGTVFTLYRCGQMQGYLLDEPHLGAHQPIELRAVGRGGKSALQMARCIVAKVPLTAEAPPPGEDGEGDHFAGIERGIGPIKPLFLRAGLAEVVDHNVECSEESVYVDHEPVPFPSGSVSKPTLVCGHLPLKSSTDDSHQALKRMGL